MLSHSIEIPCRNIHTVVEFNGLLIDSNILHVGVVIVNHPLNFWGDLHLRYLVFWIAQKAQSIRVEENGIIAHGIVHSRLIVELDLEVV